MDAKFSSHNIMLSHSSTAKHEYIIKSEFRAGEVGDKLVESQTLSKPLNQMKGDDIWTRGEENPDV